MTRCRMNFGESISMSGLTFFSNMPLLWHSLVIEDKLTKLLRRLLMRMSSITPRIRCSLSMYVGLVSSFEPTTILVRK